MRSMLHVDMNNFYASIECLYRPEIRNFPVAVAGNPLNRHGIILAKNMLAKKLGVTTGEAIWEAKLKAGGVGIRNQLQEDISNDQISMKELFDPFTGEPEK